MTTPPVIGDENIGPIIQITDNADTNVEGEQDGEIDMTSLIRETLPLQRRESCRMIREQVDQALSKYIPIVRK